jgi:hypothetical protein
MRFARVDCGTHAIVGIFHQKKRETHIGKIATRKQRGGFGLHNVVSEPSATVIGRPTEEVGVKLVAYTWPVTEQLLDYHPRNLGTKHGGP